MNLVHLVARLNAAWRERGRESLIDPAPLECHDSTMPKEQPESAWADAAARAVVKILEDEIKAERERCATIAEEMGSPKIAAAIRGPFKPPRDLRSLPIDAD